MQGAQAPGNANPPSTPAAANPTASSAGNAAGAPSAAPASDKTAEPAPSAPSAPIVPPDFYHADTNFDARISFEEAQQIWLQLTRRQFDAADLDGSGSLNADEYGLLVKYPPKTPAPHP